MYCAIPRFTVFLGFLLTAWAFEGSAVLAQTPTQTESGSAAVPDTPVPLALYLKDGTPVRVRMLSSISSGTAKVDDKIGFSVASDVIAGDLVVIRRGAAAMGRVGAVQKKRRRGRAGNVAIEISSVDMITGATVPLRAKETRHGNGLELDIADASIRSFGLGAPIFLLFKGQDVEVSAGTTFTAYVDGDVPLDRARLGDLQPTPKPATGLATVYLFRSETRGDKLPPIYCGAVEVAKLGGQHYVEAQIPPGEYLFRSPSIKKTIRLKAEAEQTYYIHFYPNAFLSPGTMDLADPPQSEDFMASPGWRADPKVNLSEADPAKLSDTTPLLEPIAEKGPGASWN